MLKIHIDGHSDAAMPNYVKDFPFFRWPETTKEIHSLMQENDDFIQVNNNKWLFDEKKRPSNYGGSLYAEYSVVNVH